jgi:hypothetical protein
MCVCRTISSADYAKIFIFSLKLTLAMQIAGFIVRLSSSLLWIQIYRLGASYVDTSSRAADFDLRSSFLSPVTPAVARQISDSNEILGGSIYDPAYYSSLFEDSQENKSTCGVGQIFRRNIYLFMFASMINFKLVLVRHHALQFYP